MATFVSGVSLFNPTAYLALNTDVAKAAAGLSGQALNDFAFNHFLNFGAAEGRDPLGQVTTTAVPTSLTAGKITGDIGGNGVAGGGIFDAAFYLTINTDVNAAAIAAANGLAASGKVVPANFFAAFAMTHFVQFGAVEGRNPSAAFDQAAYRSAQTDVSAAITLHLTTAIQHYLQFGEAEGRAAIPVSGAVQGGGNPGSSFVFTTSVDNLTGTTGNDTFVGDNTNTSALTVSVADAVNGGAGTDLLKIFLPTAGGALTLPSTINSIEQIYVANINAGFDFSGVTGVTSVQLDSLQGSSTFTISGQGLTLSNYTGAAVTETISSSTDTSETITLNKFGKSSAIDTLAFSDTKLTTLTISGNTASSTVQLSDTGLAVTKLAFTGDQSLTTTLNANFAAPLRTIDASAATGKISVDASGLTLNAAATFTGGAGADTLILNAGQFGTTTAGSQFDGGAGTDNLFISDTTPNYAGINATKNFEVLGLAANSSTVDASQLTSITHFSIGTVTAAQTEVINNLSNSAIVDLTASTTSVTTAPAVGANTETVNLNTSSTAAGFTTTALVTTGESTVNLVATGTSAHTITTLTLSDNTLVKVTGAAGLTVTNALTATTTGDQIDASGSTGVLSIIGTAKNDKIIGGSGADVIMGATSGVANQADTLTGGAGNDTFKFQGANTTALLKDSAGTTAIVKITDFTSGSDILNLKSGTLTKITVNSAQTIATANDLTGVYAGITAIASSTTTALQAAVVTVSAGSAAGTYLYVNDTAAGVSNTADMLINITGLSGTLKSTDFALS
jgi:hypothetical protein